MAGDRRRRHSVEGDLLIRADIRAIHAAHVERAACAGDQRLHEVAERRQAITETGVMEAAPEGLRPRLAVAPTQAPFAQRPDHEPLRTPQVFQASGLDRAFMGHDGGLSILISTFGCILRMRVIRNIK